MKNKITLENILFGLICVTAVFSSSSLMSDDVIPKQLYTIAVSAVAIFIVALKYLITRKIKLDFAVGCDIIVYVATAESLLVLFEFLIFKYFGLDIIAKGSFDNPAGLISLLCLSFPFAIYFYTNSDRRYMRLVPGVLILVAVFLSHSRAGIVISLIVIIEYILFVRNYSLFKRIAIVIVLLLLMLIVSYFINRGSADGRVLIWNAVWPLVRETSVFGGGFGVFERHYMDYQALFLQNYPQNSNYAMLADTVLVPFNEYINFYLCFGIFGTILLIGCFILIIQSYQKHRTPLKRVALLSLLVLGFISLVSYPFTYPSTYILSLFSIAVILKGSCCIVNLKWIRSVLSLFFSVLCIIIFLFTVKRISNEYIWKEAYLKNDIIKYERVYGDMRNSPQYLYNYARKQYDLGDYSKSLELALECRRNLAHYDLEMLLGDLYVANNDTEKAEQYFISASEMCPNRFIPLKALFDLYILKGEHEKAYEIAQTILDKPVKIPSRTIKLIKYKMKQHIGQDTIVNKHIF